MQFVYFVAYILDQRKSSVSFKYMFIKRKKGTEKCLFYVL